MNTLIEGLQKLQKAIESACQNLCQRGMAMSNSDPVGLPRELSAKMKQKIQNTLAERGALRPCPRCGNQQFVLADGLIAPSLQGSLDGFVIGGVNIPSAVVVCTRCGYMSQHAIGVLGLFEEMRDEKDRD